MATLLILRKEDFNLEVSLVIKDTERREYKGEKSSELPFTHFGIPLASLGLQREQHWVSAV